MGATAAARHPELVERDALRLEEAVVRLWVLLRAQVHHLRAAELTKWQVAEWVEAEAEAVWAGEAVWAEAAVWTEAAAGHGRAERRPRCFRKPKFFWTGKAERKMPDQTTAKLGGGSCASAMCKPGAVLLGRRKRARSRGLKLSGPNKAPND